MRNLMDILYMLFLQQLCDRIKDNFALVMECFLLPAVTFLFMFAVFPCCSLPMKLSGFVIACFCIRQIGSAE